MVDGPAPPYRVVLSQTIRDDLRQLLLQAVWQGVGPQALQSARVIADRLRDEPTLFGEPLYRLAGQPFQVRLGAVRPLTVSYAVHAEQPLVLVIEFHLLSY
jgi:hypothetical protein